MTQDLTNLGQRRSLPQHFSGRCVPETVRAEATQPRTCAGSTDDFGYPFSAKPMQRSVNPQEERSLGSSRATSAQIGDDLLSHVHWQR